MLVEDNKVFRKNSEIYEIFNNYFVDITEELGIYKWGCNPPDCIDLADRIKCFNHLSIQTIKDKYRCSFHFNFEFVSKVLKYINQIDCNISKSGEISPNIIKIANNGLLVPFTNCIDRCISTNSFPDELKIGDVVSVFRKQDKKHKSNYRPISLLLMGFGMFELENQVKRL